MSAKCVFGVRVFISQAVLVAILCDISARTDLFAYVSLAKRTSERVPAGQGASQSRVTAGLVTSTQLTEWMMKNGNPRGTTATISQWEYAMNKLIPGGWHSYGVNFLKPAYQGKNDPTKYTADQFLEGLRKYETERSQIQTKK